MSVEIRDATPADEAAFLRLWQGFTEGYNLTLPEGVTAFTWTRLMDPDSPLKARLACLDGIPQGFAIHQHHPSTWVMGDDGYLEDLYVAPEARGRGLGRALIEDLIAIGRARGWRRLYWLTEIGNTTARRLYDQFCENDGHIRYRMTL
ncbi:MULTISPECIES: GNAT family N-acetyltransferase [Tabrizicola]|uniref:GNAT family N-acetyltransferase n=1 Tax=Tabrizicola TaxID=1443919 RepID=UPI00107FDAD7|nr:MULTISPECIES: GNAT family N-acetyltransferase [Paracoccaceae]